MPESNDGHFPGFEHNDYQHNMHTLATITLWTIVIIGVAAGIFGFIWGKTH
jgi:hypothetical protein